jgi:hypothetical protein
MSDLRQALKDAGWRQGIILDPQNNILKHEGAIGFIVLNQTCDCISPDTKNEPYFEVLPVVKVRDSHDPQLINGRNPRRIHFQLEEDGEAIWVTARMADVILVEREKHYELKFSTTLMLSPHCLAGLIAWRASRYLRPAFPDKFEDALRNPIKKIEKVLKRHEDLIDSILLSLDPLRDLEEGERYEMQLRLMVTPNVFADSKKVAILELIAKEIEQYLGTAIEFDSPKCGIESLGAMTLWGKKSFLDFNRYDYLSFDQED